MNESNKNKAKILYKENNIENQPVFDSNDLKLLNELSSNNNNINSSKNNYNDINLKEPIILSTPYTISNNIDPKIIISSKNNSNEYHNYNSILKEKVNNLNSISKELLSNIDSDKEFSTTTKSNNLNKKNKDNKEKRETIDINDIGKILGGNIEKDDNYYNDDYNNNNYNLNNSSEMNNNLYQNNMTNSNMYIQLRNENEKLQKENISLKQELTNTINSLNEYKKKESNKENDNKQIEYKLHSLQSKLELYETSLENTKTQYEDQINKYQNQITKYEDIIKIVNSFFNNIENKFSLNLNSNNNVMNGINFEENIQKIEKYILGLNAEIKNYRLILENNSFNNPQNQNQNELGNNNINDFYLYNKNDINNINNINNNTNNFAFKDNLNVNVKKSNKLNINKYNFNYEDKKNNELNNNNNGIILNDNDEERNYINDNNEDIKINNQNFSNYQQNYMNNNNSNKDYKLLEQRVMMLEKELQFQQNVYPQNASDPRLNYFTYNNKEDERNSVIFQNDIIAERMRPPSRGSYDRIKENKKGHKIKKKKRKMMIDKIEEQQSYDKSDIISQGNNYRTLKMSKDRTNRKVNSRIKTRK